MLITLLALTMGATLIPLAVGALIGTGNLAATYRPVTVLSATYAVANV